MKTAGFFNVGDLILYGKWKNKKGRITTISMDAKGNPTVVIEPIPKGRKKSVVMQLFKIWHAKPIEQLTVKVAARYAKLATSKYPG